MTELLFMLISLAFTCLLLLLRSLFLSRMGRQRSTYYEVRPDDNRGDSSHDNSKDREPIGLSLIYPQPLAFTASADDWPSEIVVSEAFHHKLKGTSE